MGVAAFAGSAAFLASATSADAAESLVEMTNSVGHLSVEAQASARAVDASKLSDTMRFSVALKMRNFAELQSRVGHGEIIPEAELVQKYYPLASDYSTVADWLTGQGFAVKATDPNHLCIVATGTVAQLQNNLHAGMVDVTVGGVNYHTAQTAPNVPANIANVTLAINGLQPYIKAHTHLKRPAGNLKTAPNAYTPPPNFVGKVAKAYDATPATIGYSGVSEKIAILIDTFPAQADVEAFWAFNNIPQQWSNIELINANGGALDTASGEESLDVEWSSSIAPSAKVRVYATDDLYFSSIDSALARIVADVPTEKLNGLHQLSISLGLGETYLIGSGEFQTEGQYFAAIAAQGVSIFVSSGDAGSNPDDTGHNDPVQNPGPLQVEYESSDPSVTGVGGTVITIGPTGALSNEVAWQYGGGGVSRVFNRPGWQTGTNFPAGTMRLVPDVSLIAGNGAVNYLNLYVGGAWEPAGGTSFSAPMWAGFCALINEARLSPSAPVPATTGMGLLNPRVYPLLGTSSFNDVTSGSNGVYSAGPGYDLCTGLGSPDINNLITAIVNTVPPTVSTGVATSVTGTSALLNGTVNAQGSQSFPSFDYGTSITYGTNVAATPPVITGNTDTDTSVMVTGLLGHRTYHFRADASNAGGNSVGNDVTFVTPNNPPTAQPFKVVCDGAQVTFKPLVTVTDVDGDTLSITAVSQPLHGTVTNTTDSITYLPGADYVGGDSFECTVDDGNGGTVQESILVAADQVLIKRPYITGVNVTGQATGTNYQAFMVPQSGAFAGTYQTGKTKVNAIFSTAGSVVLKVGDSLAGIPNATVSKLGVPSGDAVIATLKATPGTGSTVTSANNVALVTGLIAGSPVVSVETGTVYTPKSGSGVTVRSFGTIDGNGASTFFFASVQPVGSTTSKNALCATSAAGTMNVLVSAGDTVSGKPVTVIKTLVGAPGSLPMGRWRVDDNTIGVVLTYADKSQEIYEIPASAGGQVDWVLVGSTNNHTFPLPAPLASATIASFGLPCFSATGYSVLAKLVTANGITGANSSVLLTEAGGSFSILAQAGSPATDTVGHPINAVKFKSFSDPVSGTNGSVAYVATMQGLGVTAANNTGIWFAPDGTVPNLIARTGDIAVGYGRWSSFKSLVLAGQSGMTPLFTAGLKVNAKDGVNNANSSGLWGYPPPNQMTNLLRTSQPIIVNGATRVIKTLSVLVPAPGSIGAANGFDSTGDVGVVAGFSDGHQAIFQILLP